MKSFLVGVLAAVVTANERRELLETAPQMPLSDELEIGSSVGSDMQTTYASAFQWPEADSTRFIETQISNKIKKKVSPVYTYTTWAKSLQNKNYSEFTIEAQAEIALKKPTNQGVNTAAVVIDASKRSSYEGWTTDFPPLRQDALQLMLDRGPVDFADAYGKYFISGYKYGSEQNYQISHEVLQQSLKKDLALALNEAFTSSNADLSTFGINENDLQVLATINKHEENKVKSISLAEQKILENKWEEAHDTKLSYVLQPYSVHPEYQQARRQYLNSYPQRSRFNDQVSKATHEASRKLSVCYTTLALLARDVSKADQEGNKSKLLKKIYKLQDSMKKIQEQGVTRLAVMKSCIASENVSEDFEKLAFSTDYDQQAKKAECSSSSSMFKPMTEDQKFFEALGGGMNTHIKEKSQFETIGKNIENYLKFHQLEFPEAPDSHDTSSYRAFQTWHKVNDYKQVEQGEFDLVGRKHGRVIVIDRDNSAILFGYYVKNVSAGPLIKISSNRGIQKIFPEESWNTTLKMNVADGEWISE